MSTYEEGKDTKGDSLRLATANGSTTSQAVTEIETCVGIKLDGARILDKTPRVISVAKLVAMGGVFHWDQHSGATIKIGGNIIYMPIHYGTPNLPLGTDMEMLIMT